MLDLFSTGYLGQGFKLMFNLFPLTINSLDFQLHVVPFLNYFITLALELVHLDLVISFGLLQLLVILVDFLSLNLALGKAFLETLFQALYLSL